MNVVVSIIMTIGGLIAVLAAVGLHRFSTPYARFHAAGKASPIAFLVTSVGASISLGTAGAAVLLLASTAMILTLPVGVHLMFRAVHRTTGPTLARDDLAPAERAAQRHLD